MTMLLRATNIEKAYQAGETLLAVLKGVSLELQEGEILSIVGPSGAGKSTLLHIMGFIDRPTDGEVVFRDRPISGLTGAEQAALRNRHFGFVFQMHHLLPELNVLENTLLPLMIRHSYGKWILAKGEARRRATALLERIGIAHRLKHRPSQLSGGERQRVAIARALIGDPEIVFCDEPTGNLDRATSGEIRKLILDLNRETGKTFVIVTHDEEVAAMAHRKMKIIDGLFV